MLTAIALLLFAAVIVFNIFSTRNSTSLGENSKSLKASSTVNVATSSVSKNSFTSKGTEGSITGTTISETLSNDGKVNINTADVKQLMSLTGIGEVKAQAIIDYRNKYGPFPTVGALVNVTGIGEKTLDKIIDDITVGDE